MKCGREEKGDKSEVGVGKTETLIEERNEARCEGQMFVDCLSVRARLQEGIGMHDLFLSVSFTSNLCHFSLPNPHFPFLTFAPSVLFTMFDSIQSRDATLGSRTGSQNPAIRILSVRGENAGFRRPSYSPTFRNCSRWHWKTPRLNQKVLQHVLRDQEK